jgi:hypothetical protein
MDQPPPDDRRWLARRKFWFPSGILVDRRAGLERRSGRDRRQTSVGALPAGVTAERRLVTDRRGPTQRRSEERRHRPRRPLDHPPPTSS